MHRAAVQIAAQLVSRLAEGEGLPVAVMGIVIATPVRARCIRQRVPLVAISPRYHSSREIIGLSTVAIVTSRNREVAQTTVERVGSRQDPTCNELR